MSSLWVIRDGTKEIDTHHPHIITHVCVQISHSVDTVPLHTHSTHAHSVTQSGWTPSKHILPGEMGDCVTHSWCSLLNVCYSRDQQNAESAKSERTKLHGWNRYLLAAVWRSTRMLCRRQTWLWASEILSDGAGNDRQRFLHLLHFCTCDVWSSIGITLHTCRKFAGQSSWNWKFATQRNAKYI